MQVSYGTPELKDCCLVLRNAEEKFGSAHAIRLTKMIAEAEAFEHAGEWLDFLGDDLLTNATNSFQVALGPVYTASFLAIDRYQAVDGAGQVDWSTVQYLKLLEIRNRT